MFNTMKNESEEPVNWVNARDLVGVAVVIEPQSIGEFTSNFGTKPKVVAKVTNVDSGEVAMASFIQTVLVDQLKDQIGNKVLARIYRGNAAPGKQAPFKIEDLSTDAAVVAKATAVLTSQA